MKQEKKNSLLASLFHNDFVFVIHEQTGDLDNPIYISDC